MTSSRMPPDCFFCAVCRAFLLPQLLAAVLLLLCPLASAANDAVTLQLKWRHQFQFAGYYAALHKGYYQDAGLEVTIAEGGPGIDVYEEVGSGRAGFGVCGSEVLLKWLEGEPVVALAVIFQHSPSALMTLRSSGLSDPHDLAGKTLMFTRDGAPDLWAMFLKEGVNLDALKLAEATWDLEELVQGEVDAMAAYITNTPFPLKQRDIAYNLIRPVTYGVDFYGDGMFALQQTVQENPELVLRFRQASLAGWEYAMNNPDEIIDLILRTYAPDMPRGRLQFEARAMQKLIDADLVQVGHMNPGRWKHMAETLVDLGRLESGYSLEGFIYNPEPQRSNTRLLLGLAVSLLATVVVGSVAAALFTLNRKLRREVAERTLAESSLRRSEDLLRRTGNIARVGGWQVELPLYQLSWTDQVYRIHEVGPEYSPTVDAAIDFYHPEDRPAILAAFEQLVSAAQPFDLELRINTAKGRTLWVRAHGEAESEAGRVARVFGTFQDIDDRKRAELSRLEGQLRWKALMDTLGAGVVVLGPDGSVVANNPAAADILEVQQEALFGSALSSWMAFDESGAPITAETMPAGKVLDALKPVYNEIIGYKNSGSESLTWLLCSATPVMDANDSLSEVIVVFMDVTEREETRRALRQAKEEAEQASRMKSQFLSTTSHELRTPIHGILGLSELLDTAAMDEEQAQYAAAIHQSAKGLLKIINNVLFISQLESGKLRLLNEPFPLAQVLETTVRDFAKAAGEKGLTINWSIADGVPEVVAGDAMHLKHVLENLVDNAVKFTPSGGVDIRVETADLDTSTRKTVLRFMVLDTGIGIAPADKERVFETFVQADAGLNRNFEGIGLGLAICKQLVKLMGGEISLENNAREGCTVTFTASFGLEQDQSV